MSEEKFQDASALDAWLKGKYVDPEKAAAVFQKLFDEGYDLPSTLIGVSFEELTGYGISNPVARHLTNKLKEAAQRQEEQQRPHQDEAVPTKRPRITVFQVGLVVNGAFRSNGARGNVYKLLERHKGFYSQNEGVRISYEEDDLRAKAYFKTEDNALEFQNAMNQWEIHKELANLDGVEIIPKTPQEINAPGDLQRFVMQDYNPVDSESPRHSLNQLHSYRLSVPVTEVAEPNDSTTKYQSLDVPVGRIKPYRCHLKDKARFKALQRDENNIVVASWPFHQMLDGLNTMETSIPLVALSVKSVSEQRSAAHANRYCVTVGLEFFDSVDADAFQPKEGAKRTGDKTWETVVFVLNKTVFQQCVEWKGKDTQEKWQRHREFLEQE